MRKKGLFAQLASGIAMGAVVATSTLAAQPDPATTINFNYVSEQADAPVAGLNFRPLPEILVNHKISDKLSLALGIDVENPDGTLSFRDSDVSLNQALVTYKSGDIKIEAGKHEYLGGNLWLDIFPNGRPSINAEEAGFGNQIQGDQTGIKITHTKDLGEGAALRTSGSLTRSFPVLNGNLFGDGGSADGGLTTNGVSPILNVAYLQTTPKGSWKVGVEGGRYAAGDNTASAQSHVSTFGSYVRDLGKDVTLNLVHETAYLHGLNGIKAHHGLLSSSYAEVAKVGFLGVSNLSSHIGTYAVHVPAPSSGADGYMIGGGEFGLAYKLPSQFKACSVYASGDVGHHFGGADQGTHLGWQAGMRCTLHP